ncbi:zinc-binding dehydrogenase [Christiangramia sp.]|uniref:MDR/zinc-dependent alcohol dehydrogenase-like family protein n=1 Tax=Christiangramia sp. TaxID=1931228 RepID=UPI002602E757|nr:zinc-binding dehydrogenase [Christiangramia sp.]
MRISREIQEMPALPKEDLVYKAAVIKQPGRVSLEEYKVPKPDKNEVRIKLEGSGVCTSNIPLWEGREWFDYPIEPGQPGHEGWGIIEEIGSEVKGFTVGERVTGLTYNAYATYDIATPENLVKLPDFLDDKPFPGEPLGCAMNIFNRSDIHAGQTIAVVGCGFLGLLLIQLIKSRGAKVIAISKREFSLKAAEEAGADEMIPMDDYYKIIEEVKNNTGGLLCHRVIEATGKEWPLNLSIELTAEKGKLIVAGFHQDGMRNLNVQMLNWRGIDMISAHERDPKQYSKGIKDAIEAIRKNEMDPFPLFTHKFSLEEMEKAFQHLTERPDGFIKALVINNKSSK